MRSILCITMMRCDCLCSYKKRRFRTQQQQRCVVVGRFITQNYQQTWALRNNIQAALLMLPSRFLACSYQNFAPVRLIFGCCNIPKCHRQLMFVNVYLLNDHISNRIVSTLGVDQLYVQVNVFYAPRT